MKLCTYKLVNPFKIRGRGVRNEHAIAKVIKKHVSLCERNKNDYFDDGVCLHIN